MYKSILMFYCLVILWSCNSTKKSHTEDNAINFEDRKIAVVVNDISLKVNNKNIESIGYKVWQEDENEGVKSICLTQKYIYLTDVFHNNIKKVEILTGLVESSQRIPAIGNHYDEKVWLRDITVFNKEIYVTSDLGYLFVFGMDLNLKDKIEIGTVGQFYFFSQTVDKLEVFLRNKQNTDLTMNLELLNISKNGDFNRSNMTMELNDFQSRSLNYYSKGKEIKLLNDNKTIISKYWSMKVVDPINTTSEYDSFNIDYSENKLAYFNSTQDELFLRIYEIRTPTGAR